MTRQQVLRIFERLRATPTDVSLQSVSVLLANGELYDGEAFSPSTDGLLQMNVTSVADAHIMKGPRAVFVDVAAILAITSFTVPTPDP